MAQVELEDSHAEVELEDNNAQVEDSSSWGRVQDAMGKADDRLVTDWMSELQNTLTFVSRNIVMLYPD